MEVSEINGEYSKSQHWRHAILRRVLDERWLVTSKQREIIPCDYYRCVEWYRGDTVREGKGSADGDEEGHRQQRASVARRRRHVSLLGGGCRLRSVLSKSDCSMLTSSRLFASV